MYLLPYLKHSGFGLWTYTPWIPTHESKDPVDGVDSLWKAPTDIQQTELLMSYCSAKHIPPFLPIRELPVFTVFKSSEETNYAEDRVPGWRNSAIIYQFIYLGRVMSWIMNRQIIFISKNLILALKIVEERRMCGKLGRNLEREKCRLVKWEMCLSFPWKYSIYFSCASSVKPKSSL